MKRINITILGVIIATCALAQDNPLSVFDNLVSSAWISEGKQLGGFEGKTIKEFSYGLDGKMVKVKTSTTDPKTGEFGLRNEGVRFFNTQSKMVEFYEFDKLGTISTGIIKVDGKNIYYEYEYGGNTLRDSWIYLSKDEYQYQVCSVNDNTCDQVYHKGIFVRDK